MPRNYELPNPEEPQGTSSEPIQIGDLLGSILEGNPSHADEEQARKLEARIKATGHFVDYQTEEVKKLDEQTGPGSGLDPFAIAHADELLREGEAELRNLHRHGLPPDEHPDPPEFIPEGF